ncbi:MAG: BrnT family toxin [Desulfobacula sp.]|uniref:BrnT family toxin n=1 Tax=Desulfobacula sp. TaxID=2593537 RepID=UPI0025C60AD2|nr:BrnT family toxin [Desulfobacula sp.]MCD4719950.1 BrnT family toxin [Desulfobacula sp.]
MDDKNKIFLRHCTGFDWDDGNIDKNWKKHKVTPSECEQIFFNLPLIIQNDAKHSEKEVRYYSLGQTNVKRLLFIAFTIRNNFIRVVSARDMSRKERKAYEKANS